MIGVDLGALTPATGAAFVAAGLVSALVFPVLSLALLRPAAAGATDLDAATEGPVPVGAGSPK